MTGCIRFEFGNHGRGVECEPLELCQGVSLGVSECGAFCGVGDVECRVHEGGGRSDNREY